MLFFTTKAFAAAFVISAFTELDHVTEVAPGVGVIVISPPSTPVPMPVANISLITPESVTVALATSLVAEKVGMLAAGLPASLQLVAIPPFSWIQRPTAVFKGPAAASALPTLALIV